MLLLPDYDWSAVTRQLLETGYARLPNLLSPAVCADLIARYDDETQFRKTINMAQYRFGLGEYKYFSYPLPPVVDRLRTELYPHLAPVANTYLAKLNLPTRFPSTLSAFLTDCAEQGQTRPTPLLLRYGPGGYNALHQDLYGDVFFPFQAVVILNEPGRDFAGGEFVLVEQRPRMQSKAVVLTPNQGDSVIFTTNFRPVDGTRGAYRVSLKHGVSEVTSGRRHTLGIIFHNAK